MGSLKRYRTGIYRVADIQSFNAVDSLGAKEQIACDINTSRHFDGIVKACNFRFCRVGNIDDLYSCLAHGDIQIVALMGYLTGSADIFQYADFDRLERIADIVNIEIFSGSAIKVTLGDFQTSRITGFGDKGIFCGSSEISRRENCGGNHKKYRKNQKLFHLKTSSVKQNIQFRNIFSAADINLSA